MTLADDDTGETGARSTYQVHDLSKRPRRRRRSLVIAIAILGAVCLAIIAVAGGFYLTFALNVHAANSRVTPEVQKALDTPPPNTLVTVPQGKSQPGTPETQAEPPINLLLLGSDARPDGKDSTGSSDVIMILHIDRANNFLSVLSVTRDLWVAIPGYGQDRINAAYTRGGAALTVATLKQTFGLDITEYVEVGFDSFAKIVDALGGTYVDVDRRYTNEDGSLPLAPGYQLLDGAHALSYARYRHDENADFGRMARQQRVLASLRDQFSGRDLSLKMPGMVNTLLDYSATNVGANEMLKLGYWLARLDDGRIKHIAIRSGGTIIDDDRPPVLRRTARKPESRSSPSTDDGASAAGGRARTTSREPGGRLARRGRTRWRSLRATRCRTTDPPTARLTTKPARGGASAGSGASAGTKRWTTSRGRPTRRPRRTAEGTIQGRHSYQFPGVGHRYRRPG